MASNLNLSRALERYENRFGGYAGPSYWVGRVLRLSSNYELRLEKGGPYFRVTSNELTHAMTLAATARF